MRMNASRLGKIIHLSALPERLVGVFHTRASGAKRPQRNGEGRLTLLHSGKVVLRRV